jgi:hypothetical protein
MIVARTPRARREAHGRWPSLIVGLVGVFASGCEAVPDLTFADAAAAHDAQVSAPDAREEGGASADGGGGDDARGMQGMQGGDGSADGATAELDGGGDTGSMCSGAMAPPAPYVCCGAVFCQGQCGGQCDACSAKCTPGQVCCAKTNNVVCLSPGGVCH